MLESEREYEYKYRWSRILPSLTVWLLFCCLSVFMSTTDNQPWKGKGIVLQAGQEARWLFSGLSLLFFAFAGEFAVKLYHSLVVWQRIVIGKSGIVVPSTYWSNDESEILWNSIKQLELETDERGSRKFLDIHIAGTKYRIFASMLETERDFDELVVLIKDHSIASPNLSQTGMDLVDLRIKEIDYQIDVSYILLALSWFVFLAALLFLVGFLVSLLSDRDFVPGMLLGSVFLCGTGYVLRIISLRSIRSLRNKKRT